MKKIALGVMLLFIMTFCCGCEKVEPEGRAFPLALGFDWSQEAGYTVYYAMPDLGPYTGEGKTSEKMELLWTYTGANYDEISQMIQQTKEQVIDLGHVQAILLGKGILEEHTAYEETIQYLVNQTMLSSGAYLFQTDDVKMIMEENGQTVDSLGEYLVDIMDKEKQWKPVLLQDLYNAYYNEETTPSLYKVHIDENRIEVKKFKTE